MELTFFSGYFLYAACATSLIAIFSLINVIYLKTATKKPATEIPETENCLKVSVLIPARNEQANIESCLNSILHQDYENFEVIVLNDNSTDRTGEILTDLQKSEPKLKVINGKKLPEDWNGKPYAMQQLAEAASGEILFFADSDTVHRPDSIQWAVTNLEFHKVDAISGYTKQIPSSYRGQLVVSSLFYPVMMFFPLWLVKRTKLPLWSIAIGQFFIFKAECFREINGYYSIRKRVTEDVYMARYIKSRGYKLIFLNARKYISCKCYSGFNEAMEGIGKNVTEVLGSKYPLLIPFSLYIFSVFIMPFIFWLYFAIARDSHIFNYSALLIGQAVLCKVILYNTGFRFDIPIFFPMMFLVIIMMVQKAIFKRLTHRTVVWKGRVMDFNAAEAEIEKNGEPPILNFSFHFRVLSAFVYYPVLFILSIVCPLLFGFRVKGRKNLKGIKKAILISNHCYYVDPGMVALAVAPQRLYFSTLESTINKRGLGTFLRLLGSFPIPSDNPSRIVRPVKKAIDHNMLIHFFPEGVLYDYNQNITDFKIGAFHLASLFEIPVIPIVIVLKKHKLIFKSGRRIPRVTIVIGEPIFQDAVAMQNGANRREKIDQFCRFSHDKMQAMIETENGCKEIFNGKINHRI